MTISQISVWNRALGFLGTRSVASEQENTPEALQCRLYWDSARRQVLRDFPWSFAQRRAWMPLVPLPEGFAPEFRFAYALPDDCLKVHEVRHEGAAALEVLAGVRGGRVRGRPALVVHQAELGAQ